MEIPAGCIFGRLSLHRNMHLIKAFLRTSDDPRFPRLYPSGTKVPGSPDMDVDHIFDGQSRSRGRCSFKVFSTNLPVTTWV
jgi:hypothetical protein